MATDPPNSLSSSPAGSAPATPREDAREDTGTPPRGNDLRARDLVTRSPAELEEQLDPETLAKLAAWFALPSFTELAERGEPVADEDAVALRELRQKLDDVADPALMDRLELRTEQVVIQFREIVKIAAVREIGLINLRGMAQDDVVVPEVEIPPALNDDLRQCTPQALLRDLHRPDLSFMGQLEPPEPPEPPLDAVREVREIMTTRYFHRPDRPVLLEARDAVADLVYWKRAPWDSLPIVRATVQSPAVDTESSPPDDDHAPGPHGRSAFS